MSFDDKLDTLLAVDVVATVRLTREVGRRMKAQGGGRIVTMGWDQAETGMEGDSGELFAATKGAVLAFTRSLALSLAPTVRVNAVAPGWIKTSWGEIDQPRLARPRPPRDPPCPLGDPRRRRRGRPLPDQPGRLVPDRPGPPRQRRLGPLKPPRAREPVPAVSTTAHR